MFAKPQAEHHWLHKLVGQWQCETEAVMDPDQPPQLSTSDVNVRMLGGLWAVIETRALPEQRPFEAIMTLGYDPARKQYVGTFVGSMMTFLWQYEAGSVDESGKKLVLDAEGPAFSGEGNARYKDTIEQVDDDYWTLSSQVLGEDGKWNHFMTAHHRRKK